MQTALKFAVALLTVGLLFTPAAYGQEEELPIDPDSVYHLISPISEQMLGGQKVPTKLSVAEWREDLNTLAAAMRRRIPYFQAAAGGSFAEKLDSLKRALPGQTRDQRILSVMRLLNLPAPGTGHTGIRTSQRALGWRALPLYPYRFADGVYVMSAADPDLIGSEVLAIGGVPVDSVYASLAPYVSADNRWDRWRGTEPWPLQFLWANPLRALGIVDQIDAIPVHVRTEDGDVRRVNVETMRPNSASFVSFFASGSKRIDTPPSLWWSPATRRAQDNNEPNYHISYRDSTDLLYVPFNAVENASPDWTVADLADSLRHIADQRPISKVVLDLRTNNGGDSYLAEPLVEVLGSHPKIDRRGTLYALTSPITYSAAGMFAMELERRTKTIFAGEPGGFAPNIWGEFAPVLLPNSKITVLLSYAYHQAGMPGSPRTHLKPDIHVPLTSGQHFSNVDSTMIAVRQHDSDPWDTVLLTSVEQERFTGTYRLSPIHTARVTKTDEGLHLQVDRGRAEPFIDSDLYPLSPTRLATDIREVYLERTPDRSELTLVWKDTTYALMPTDPNTKLPLEHIRAGRLKQGVQGLHEALNTDLKLSDELTEEPLTNLLEDPLPAWPDILNRQERARKALPYTKLAVKLRPMSWLVHFYLAEIYEALGRTEDALQALRKIRELYPARYEDALDWLELEGEAGEEKR